MSESKITEIPTEPTHRYNGDLDDLTNDVIGIRTQVRALKIYFDQGPGIGYDQNDPHVLIIGIHDGLNKFIDNLCAFHLDELAKRRRDKS